MSAEELQDNLVDLLYDDELDEQTRAPLRRAVEESSAGADLAEFETMLAMIRDSADDQAPSPGVRTSLLEAAREHAQHLTEEDASAQAQVISLHTESGHDGIFARIGGHQTTQLVLAACALLGAGFLFYLFQMRPDHTTASLAPEPAPMVQAAAQEAPIDREAAEPAESPLDGAQMAKADLPQAAAEESASEEAPAAPTAERDNSAATPPKGSRRAAPPARPRPEPEIAAPAPAKKKSEAEPSAERKRAAKARTSSARYARRRPQTPSKSLDKVFGGFAAEGRSASTDDLEPAPEQAAEAAPSDLGGIVGSLALADDQASSSAGSVSRAPSSLAEADAPAAPPAEVAPATGRGGGGARDTSAMDTIEDVYLAGDDARVIRLIDRFIASAAGDRGERARALELKALALRRTGRISESEKTLGILQTQYPEYRPDRVRRLQAELAEQRREDTNRRKKRAAPANERERADETDTAKQPAASPASE